jgi:hypothetical protein
VVQCVALDRPPFLNRGDHEEECAPDSVPEFLIVHMDTPSFSFSINFSVDRSTGPVGA